MKSSDRSNVGILLTMLTKMLHALSFASLSTGLVPPQFKWTIVTPLMKKQGIDSNDMKNFRSVSNLSFISKILENVVADEGG